MKQLLKPLHLQPVWHNKGSHHNATMRSLHTAMKCEPFHPTTATRKSAHAAAKTWHSQKNTFTRLCDNLLHTRKKSPRITKLMESRHFQIPQKKRVLETSGAVVLTRWGWDVKDRLLGSVMVSTCCPPPGICHTSHLVTLSGRAVERPCLRPGYSCNPRVFQGVALAGPQGELLSGEWGQLGPGRGSWAAQALPTRVRPHALLESWALAWAQTRDDRPPPTCLPFLCLQSQPTLPLKPISFPSSLCGCLCLMFSGISHTTQAPH